MDEQETGVERGSNALNLSVLAKEFSDEEAAYLLLEELRWPNGPVCPHCGSVNRAYFLKPRNGYRETRTGARSYRRLWKCADNECRKQFSVLVGTIFEDSKIPVSKWLIGMSMMNSNKNGKSAHELSRDLGITVKGAWFMAHRIRYAMSQDPLAGLLQGVVEADETWFGGHARNMHKKERERRFGNSRGTTGKTAVVTRVQRDGEARSRVMEKVDGATMTSS